MGSRAGSHRPRREGVSEDLGVGEEQPPRRAARRGPREGTSALPARRSSAQGRRWPPRTSDPGSPERFAARGERGGRTWGRGAGAPGGSRDSWRAKEGGAPGWRHGVCEVSSESVVTGPRVGGGRPAVSSLPWGRSLLEESAGLSRKVVKTGLARDRRDQGFPDGSSGRGFACSAGSVPGGGNGNALQYSCLENPMGRGAWWATVHGVTEGWTRLSDQTHTHAPP